jgi:phenol/toluene 2-monooxygenase (NADH) P1/A1
MQIDLQSINIKPLRQTFDHLAARFGDKPASRYQEGTYDVQQTFLYHYRPSWEPGLEIFDERRTAIRMKDWYDLKDPRQYYYATYTITRAKQQDAADAAFEFAIDGGLLDDMPDPVAELVSGVLTPLRHFEWGANMNNTFISAYCYGTAIDAAASFAAMDRLGMAQQISRIALESGGPALLDSAKEAWLQAPHWQPLRHAIEDTLVVKDWFELFTAQNLVLDDAVLALVYDHVAARAAEHGSPVFGMLTRFMKEWRAETRRWVDAVMKAAAADSHANRELIRGWVRVWSARADEAAGALARHALGEGADAALLSIGRDFQMRLEKLDL